MKKLIFASLLLAACAPANKSSSTAGAQNASPTCPIVNGTFERTYKEGGSDIIRAYPIATETSNGIAYRIGRNGDFLLADGSTKRIDSEEGHGSFRVQCSSSSFDFMGNEDGKTPFTLKFTVLNANEIYVDSSDDPAGNGIYKRVQ